MRWGMKADDRWERSSYLEVMMMVKEGGKVKVYFTQKLEVSRDWNPDPFGGWLASLQQERIFFMCDSRRLNHKWMGGADPAHEKKRLVAVQFLGSLG